MKRLLGKKAVVTGGGNGIGRAIAEAFAREGADVLFTIHSDRAAAEELVQTGEKHGVKMGYLQLDAGAFANVTRLFEESAAFHREIDILVNNAAVISRSAFLDISLDEYRRILDVNLQFPFFTTQIFARHMKENEIKGSIINISSVSAFRAISKMAHYQCSKAGLSMLTKSAAYELAGDGIRVNTISPGLTATKANRNQWRDDPELWRSRGKDIPLGRPGVANDHAGAAVFLASDESSWMTGSDLVIDGGDCTV